MADKLKGCALLILIYVGVGLMAIFIISLVLCSPFSFCGGIWEWGWKDWIRELGKMLQGFKELLQGYIP
jgi:hypothetical protein